MQPPIGVVGKPNSMRMFGLRQPLMPELRSGPFWLWFWGLTELPEGLTGSSFGSLAGLGPPQA